MWIRGWSVDTFGHLEQTHLDGLTEGVNVVLGPNESGKTTALHFLRWVLFGFPHARTLAMQKYRSGNSPIGGRVHIGHGCDTINVERHYGDDRPTLSALDGSSLPSGLWGEVVGNAGKELFEAVFAITADDLNDFSSLSTDEVREHIYAAGIVGHGPSARGALAKLDNDRSGLLKRRSGRIRDIHRHLDDATEALRIATATAIGLAKRRSDLDDLRALADECDRHRRQVETDAAHLEDLITSWPSWTEATELRRQLAHMPVELELPVDPLGRLEALIAALDASTAELDDVDLALRANDEQRQSVAIDDRLPPVAVRTRELDRRSVMVAKLEADLIGLTSTEQHQAGQLAEALSDLGPGWTVERIKVLDLSLVVFQRAREFAEGTRSVRSEADRTLSILQQAQGTEAERARWERLARDLQPAEARIPRLAVATLLTVALLCVITAALSFAFEAPLPAIGFLSVTCVAGWLSVMLHRHRATTARPDPGAHPHLDAGGLQALSVDHRDALAAQEALAAEWADWLDRAGLPSTLRPEDCVELLERMRSTRAAAEAHDATTRAISAATEEIDHHRREVAELLTRAGMDAMDRAATLGSLLVAVSDDEHARREMDELDRTRAALEGRREHLSEKVAQARASLDELLACASVDDTEEFRVVASREAARHHITERLSRTEVELSGRFGNDEAVDTARAELAAGDPDTWNKELAALEERRAEALAAYESAFEHFRAEAAAIAEAEGSADVAALSLQVEGLRSELREAMDDWTVATLAHRAIDETLGRFETERQPEVMRYAAESFRRVTAGRYTGLVPAGDSLQVVRSDGSRLDSRHLSRGTTEQLYLVMRLALARQYARSNALPLLLDDVLVNADRRRALRMAEELHEVAGDLQVVVFTCHHSTAELLAGSSSCDRARRSANIVEMAS